MKFDRVAELEVRIVNEAFQQISTIGIKNLRISFNIKKTLSSSTNTANIQVYNLKKEKRAQINDYGDQVVLKAGYIEESGANLLFIGDTTTVSHLYEQPEIISSLTCGDCERILNQALINISYGTDSSVKEILQGISNAMGFEGQLNLSQFNDIIYKQGFVHDGMGKTALDIVTNFLGATWSVQNNQLTIVPKNGSTSKPPIVISQNTGMIGVPQRYTNKRRDLFRVAPKQGYKVRTLLDPQIIPGNKVRLISDQINVDEVLFINSVNHVGDTYGDAWYSNLELIRI